MLDRPIVAFDIETIPVAEPDSMTSDAQALGDRFAAALAEAFRLHRDQYRKRSEDEKDDGPGIPYMAHLMSVAALVLEHGGDQDEAIAALLHDGPEDQGGQEVLDDIRRQFGDRVADIVEACSDTLETKKPEWRPRKELYLDHLRKTTSPSVFLISLADKVHNLRSIVGDYRRIGDRLWDRFTGKRDGTLWYYGELLKVYQDQAPDRCADLVQEMERAYRDLVEIQSMDGAVGTSQRASAGSRSSAGVHGGQPAGPTISPR